MDLEFPLQNVPDEYEGVIAYWSTHPDTNHPELLHAQLRDWKRFCNFQGKIRRYHLPRETFPIYLEKVGDRRQRHGLEGGACLHPEREQQSGFENWIEYQDYHLEIHEGIEKDIRDDKEKLNHYVEIHERFEKDIKDDRENLNVSQKQSERADALAWNAQNVEHVEYRLRYSEGRSRHHKNLLRWIEQQRMAMAAGQAMSVHDNGSPSRTSKVELRAVRTSSTPSHQNQARTALNPVRSGVSSKTPRKRRRPQMPQMCDVPPAAEKATVDSSAPQRSSKRIMDLQEKKPRRAKESTPLRPFRSQKVSKNGHAPRKQPTNVNAKPRPTSRSKRRKPMEQLASVVKTRSGRESRRPLRLCPD